MSSDTDADYFARRAARHQELAERATDLTARTTHQHLRDLYVAKSAANVFMLADVRPTNPIPEHRLATRSPVSRGANA